MTETAPLSFELTCGDRKIEFLADIESFKVDPRRAVEMAAVLMRDGMFPDWRYQQMVKNLRDGGMTDDEITQKLPEVARGAGLIA